MAAGEIEIHVEAGDVTDFAADALLLKYARGFHGADQEVAVALQRSGAAELAGIDPKPGEVALVRSNRAIPAEQVLFVGTARLSQLRYAEVRQVVTAGLAALKQQAPATQHVALTLHGPNIGLDESQAFLSELRGLSDAVQSGAAPPQLKKVTFVERNANRAKRLRELLDLTGFALRGPGQTIVESVQRASEADTTPHAFVAMAFGKDTDDVFYYGIQKPVHAAGLLCERVDQVSFTGDIVERIVRQIETAELVIAEVTGANPNVYLEIGYAWGKGVPILLLARSPSELRFDVRNHRALFYDRIYDLERALTTELGRLPKGRRR
jgi:hypothetical protein